jgi:hypothetical protein
MTDHTLDRLIANAILGLDTLWGGDVMCPSGTGRFIADSWFSDEPLPEAYTHDTADAVRGSGGLSAERPNVGFIDAYLDAVNVAEALGGVRELAPRVGGVRGAFLAGMSQCLDVMWDLAMEALDRGDPVPYARSVEASCARPPSASDPDPKVAAVAELLSNAGYSADSRTDLGDAVAAWRRDRRVAPATIPALSRALIAELDAGAATHLLPHLPEAMAAVPRANVEFLPIEDAWFSGSMNYVGRDRDAAGRPAYEATYELNASLEISLPEFHELVSHEVVPGHVTTFAYVQSLYVLGEVGFEGTVLTMNTRYSTLAEGIANNAALIACGVIEIGELPDPDLQIGTLLSRLQDDAKNQASFLTWNEDMPQSEVAAELQRDYLVTEERAQKLSGPWAHHPLLGRMYLPAYRAGTERVTELRRHHDPAAILPALYGVRGLVDVATIDQVL